MSHDFWNLRKRRDEVHGKELALARLPLATPKRNFNAIIQTSIQTGVPTGTKSKSSIISWLLKRTQP